MSVQTLENKQFEKKRSFWVFRKKFIPEEIEERVTQKMECTLR